MSSHQRIVETPIAFEELYYDWRYKIFWGGRGGAKSTAFADALLALGDESPLRILCAREKQNSIKESVHNLLESRIKLHGYTGYTVLQTEIRHVNGTRIFFAGLWNNIDSIKSMEAIDICWIEEANTVSSDSWRKLVPTIRKPGSEIWASFNPEHKFDAVYERFVLHTPPKSAFVKKVSWRDNPWFTEEMRDEMEDLKERDYDEYLHVWEGELRQYATGAIYEKQLKELRDQGRVCSIPIASGVEVHTFWDLGRDDTTAIWFMQVVGREHRFIDYYENRLVDLDHYARMLKEKDYLYGRHYLPHDVTVTELSSLRGSRKEILESSGVKPIKVVPRIPNINDGIERARRALSQCWFDETRCEAGLASLSNYQYLYDEQYDTFRQTPLHNWASNGADAFRQYAQGFSESYQMEPGQSWTMPSHYFE